MRILAWPGMEIGRANPYTKLLYEPMQRAGHTIDEFTFVRALTRRYDIVHFHWPEYYVANPNRAKAMLGSPGTLMAAAWARARGAKLVWTAHNLHSHHGPRPRMEAWFWRAFVRLVDAFTVMTESGREELLETYPSLHEHPCFVIPHGHYRGEYPNAIGKGAARDSLEIPKDARVICFLGSIAPYKGVAGLVSAFRRLRGPQLRLLLAGASEDPREAEFLRAQASEDDRIRLHLGYVAKEEVQSYMNAADLVALPFQKVWNSGSAMLALSFDRPILVPARGAFLELRSLAGRDWVRTYEGELTPAELEAALEWSHGTRRGESAPLDKFDWAQISNETLGAYSRVAALDAIDDLPDLYKGRERRTGHARG